MPCLFCQIVAKEIPAQMVKETDELVAIKDLHPQAPLHLLIVPRKHIASLDGLSDPDTALVGRLVATARDLAREHGVAEAGYRVVVNCNSAGGQTVFHLHLHLLGGRTFRWPPG